MTELDMRMPVVLSHGIPDSTTPGWVGLLAMDVTQTSKPLYKCTAADNQKKVYAWKPIESGGGGSGGGGDYILTDADKAEIAIAVSEIIEIPAKTSDLQNDSGFITGYTETDPTVPAWAKQPKKPTYTADEVGALPATTKIPAKTSELTNDSGFVTRISDDLENYYTKDKSYSRTEIDEKISVIPKFSIEVVSELPTSDISSTTVYLVGGGLGSDLYVEYIYVNGAWEILGAQRVDLTGYAKETWVNAKIADFLTADKLTAAMVTGALGFTPAKATDVPAVDSTLKVSGAAADAKAVGDKVNQLSAEIADLGGTKSKVDNAVGATYPPAQKPAAVEFDGYDIDILDSTADNVYSYIDNVVNGKNTVTKEILGKDASGQYEISRYTYASREYVAWCKENHPRMYAWKNGSDARYTTSVSPKINDRAYSNPYVETSGTTTVTVPAKACVAVGVRYSQSGGAFGAESGVSSVVLPLPKNPIQAPVISLVGMTMHTVRTYVYGGTEPTSFPTTIGKTTNSDNSGFTVVTDLDVLKNYSYIVFFVASTGTSGEYANAKILLDGVEMAFETTTDINAIGSIATQETTTTVTTEGGGTPITAVSATNRSRTIGGVEYVRYADGDVAPTVIYTAVDDNRNSGTTITQDGITYNRYPLGDLGSNREKLIPVFIYANEHGVIKDITSSENHEGKMPALVAARLLRDIVSGAQAKNPLYQYFRDNCMLIVIPVANPFGFNYNVSSDANTVGNGYYNANSVNINRNYDTPGWDVFKSENPGAAMGAYPGSEIETQYIMNTIAESGAVVAISLHGYASGNGKCAHQGQNPGNVDYNQDKLAKINAFLETNWGYSLVYYDEAPLMNTPDITSKSPSYITQCGAYGGIVEISPDDNRTSGLKQEANQHVCENAYAQVINLTAMWLSDYLEA